MTRYRLIWFVVDPFSGGRVPLGALVERAGGVSFVMADRGSRRALSPNQQVLADIVCEALADATSFDVLPAGTGPQVITGEPVVVPQAVTQPDRWVAERVLGVAA